MIEDNAAKSCNNFDIPENMCCKITFELLKEPIITPDGICYEKKILQEHFSKNGFFDPVTRKPLQPNKFNPNNALAEAIEKFEENNPWSHEFINADEDYRQIIL